MRIFLLLFSSLALAAAGHPAFAQQSKYPSVFVREDTSAGEFSVVQLERGWELRLNGRVIYRGESLSIPEVLAHFRGGVPPFDEVLVLHRMAGTYCNGGTFRFLGVKRDGSYTLTHGIGECFAAFPVAEARNGAVRVSVRGGYGNNPLPGEPYLPGGTWVFKKGRVSKVSRRATSRPG